MKITLDFLIDTNAVGILARITLLLMEKNFIIVDHSREKPKHHNEKYHLILSLSYNYEKLSNEIVDSLIQELKTVEHVHEVLKTDLKNKESLLTIGNHIVQSYPDIMIPLNEYAKKLDREDEENKTAILYEVGKMVGKKIAINHYKFLHIDESITKALKKIVLPVISPFSLAKVIDNELHVSVCPFCMSPEESIVTVTQCDFLTGFIVGLIKTKQDVYVEKIKCRAYKSKTCIFSVSKKY